MTTNVGYDHITVSVTGQSKTGTKSTYVQNAITKTEEIVVSDSWGNVTITFGSGLTAGGGSFTVSASQSGTRTYYNKYTYTSGSTSNSSNTTKTITNSSFTYSISHQSFSTSTSQGTNGNISRYSISGSKVSHTSMTTNVGYDHVTVKVVGAGSKSNTKSTYVQNSETTKVDSTTWNNPVITFSSGLTAGGGSFTVSATQSGTEYYHHEYTSGSKDSASAHNRAVSNTSFTYAISHQSFSTTTSQGTAGNISRYSISGSKVSHTSMTSNVGYDHITVKVTGAGSKSNTKSTYVQNSSSTADHTVSDSWNNPVVSIGSGITAGGGSATVSATQSGTRTYFTRTTYTSGTTSDSANKTKSISNTSFTFKITHQSFSTSTSQGTNNNISRFSISSATLSHSSMTSNVGYDHVTVQATGSGSKTGTKSTYVQNSRTEKVDSTSWNNPVVTIGSGMTAAGGSATVSATQSGTQYYHYEYTSGTKETASYRNRTVSNSSFTFSMTANGNSRFSFSSPTITHSGMGQNLVTDTVTIKAVGSGSKSGTGSKSITNTRWVTSVSIASFSYSPNPCSSAASQTMTPSIGTVTANYKYDSGSTKSETVSASNYTKSFTIAAGSYFSLNSSTGVVTTRYANSSQNQRSDVVNCYITVGGVSGNKACTVYQKGSESITFSISSVYLQCPATIVLSTRPAPQYSDAMSGTKYSLPSYGSITIPTGESINVVGFGGNTTIDYGCTLYVVQIWSANYNSQQVGAITSFWWEPNKSYTLSASQMPFTGCSY